jgi:cytochrome c biogenesis protein
LENKEDKKKGIVDRVWDFFASIKLAVVIFSLISITSIAGTIIEQQAGPERNITLLSKIFDMTDAHAVYKVLDKIGLTDMYNTWWFITLLLVFSLNIVVCSLERLPGILKMAREPIKPLPEDRFKDAKPGREAVLKSSPGKAEEMVVAALKKIGFTGRVEKTQDMVQICAEKGRYGRLGVYVTHLSILLIMLGAVVGMKFGYNGSIKLLEGMSSDTVQLNNGREIPLGFEIRCDDFDVTFYHETERPKSYKSILTIVENGKDVVTKEIEVNDPLRYKGVTFYQSSYGFFPNLNSLFKFRYTPTDGKARDISVKFRQEFDIEDSKLTARVVDFSPALAVNREGELDTFAEAMINPAAMLEFSERGKLKARKWILRNYPETWNTPVGSIEFRDLWGVQYTGLQVRKDPGVWLVYIGCLLMAIGLYTAFFMTQSRIWIRLKEENGSTRITIASSAAKNRIALDRKLDALVGDLAKNKGLKDQGGR